MGRMRGISERPEGLVYVPDLVPAPEEERLLSRMAHESFGEVRMHGQVARRTVRHYGVGYDVESADIAASPASIGLRAERLQPDRVAAQPPRGRRGAVLDHVPDAAPAGSGRGMTPAGTTTGPHPGWDSWPAGTARIRPR